jgi:hypothetical protein
MHILGFLFFMTVLFLAVSVIGWTVSRHRKQIVLALLGRSQVALDDGRSSEPSAANRFNQANSVTFLPLPKLSLSPLDQVPLPLAA